MFVRLRSRLLCRLLGHDWVDASPDVDVCFRRACHGRADAVRAKA